MYDYVTKYKPEYIWSDGDVGPPEYWTSQELLAWLYNDRWGDNILVFITCLAVHYSPNYERNTINKMNEKFQMKSKTNLAKKNLHLDFN